MPATRGRSSRRARQPQRGSSPRAGRSSPGWTKTWISVGIVLLVALVFGRTVVFDFVNYDDGPYVFDNPSVIGGLTAENFAWALTATREANWHPLTWWSHMLDCTVWGLDASGHHLSNVVLHAATAVLLFLALARLSGRIAPSAWVAAFFAVHPLRVESVAWVAERKDVLSGLLFMLTLIAYAHYARRPSVQRMLLVGVAFATGLMAKPMLVTLPLVLLLLDLWPLQRLRLFEAGAGGRSVWRTTAALVAEKIPLFVLSLAAGIVALLAQASGGAVSSLEAMPVGARLANAVVSYADYAVKMIVPACLAVYYPHPGSTIAAWKVVAAVIALVAVSIAVLRWALERPYLLVGWLWYLFTLAPVIGIVQVGGQAMADRYTYLTQIGLLIMLAWLVTDLAAAWSLPRPMLWAAALTSLAVYGVLAFHQCSHWRNGVTLFSRAVSCTNRNTTAHINLGKALVDEGRVDEALVQFRAALEIDPQSSDANNDLGVQLFLRGQVEQALPYLKLAAQSRPDDPIVHYSLGAALVAEGRYEEAIASLSRAVELDPRHPAARNNLGLALTLAGRPEEAVGHLQTALELDPSSLRARLNLGRALDLTGDHDGAVRQWREVLRRDPDNPLAAKLLEAAEDH